MSTLWIHKVDIYKTVDLLHQFNRCEGFSFYIFWTVRGVGRCTIEVYRFPEAAVTPQLLRLFQQFSGTHFTHNHLCLKDFSNGQTQSFPKRFFAPLRMTTSLKSSQPPERRVWLRNFYMLNQSRESHEGHSKNTCSHQSDRNTLE